MAEPKATVGVAKCPKTGNLYGVRIDIDGKRWTANWAFPIKPDVAKREGYVENVFPPDLQYDREYPGCPYCGVREDLAKISAPEKKPLKIKVTAPGYDNIGGILKSLGIPFSPVTVGLACDVLFLNCGTSTITTAHELRSFVENGGCLYASDQTDTRINAAFPGLFNFGGHNGNQCKMRTEVVDKELRDVIGSTMDVEFDLGAWALLNSASGEVLLRAISPYPGLPIMVKVRYGKGVIFYTCFHNYAQASEREQALLQLLILKQLGSGGGLSLAETSAEYGVNLDDIKAKFRSNW